jgi:hypothetical protein
MASRARTAPAAAETTTDVVWVRAGLFAGFLGAAVVALFFLVLDVVAGRPLWTPHALGSALFLGSVPAPHAPVSLALIGAYTFVHGYVFVSVGLIAAFVLDWGELPERRRALFLLALAVPLFLALSLLILAFRWVRGPDAVLPFAVESVHAANALAALVMAAFLVLHRGRRERRGS